MKKKNNKSNERPIRTYKADDWDFEEMRRKAELYAEGNLSAWIRHACRMYTPKKGERVHQKAS